MKVVFSNSYGIVWFRSPATFPQIWRKTNIQPFAQHHPFNYSYTRDSKPSCPGGENPLVFETFLREFIGKLQKFSHYR
jgi:hypothetical protein